MRKSPGAAAPKQLSQVLMQGWLMLALSRGPCEAVSIGAMVLELGGASLDSREWALRQQASSLGTLEDAHEREPTALDLGA